MKKIQLAFALLVALATTATAQMKEGKISYERKTNMHRNIPDPQMKSMIPEFRTDKFELIFNESASLFRSVVDDEAPDPFANAGGGGGGMRMNFRMPTTTTYTDLAKQTQYEERAFFEKEFLIVDSLKQYKWKLSEETKTIAKQLCKKATTMIVAPQMRMRISRGGENNTDTASNAPIKPRETELVVWYAENIPVSVGPDNYSGLPGVIMEMNLDNGATVTTAVEVSAKYPKKELVQPSKGEKMTRAQFQEQMQKLMQDMQRGGGIRMGGGAVRFGGGN
ncbi:MAG: GLPGLI family protein [Sediminibacterium sp.]|nr:GLPGLI family protein [Sediminibacterium sp.]MBP6144915.1 GLPGLI family protein [Sediminibacterium sp.]